MSNPSQPPYGSQPPQFHQNQPPTPQRKRRWYLSSPIIGSAALVLGIVLGAASTSGSGSAATPPTVTKTVAAPGPTATVTATAEATATKTVTAKPKPAPTKTVTAKPEPAPTKTVTVTAEPQRDDGGDDEGDGGSGGIGDGTYIVGSEIKIGNYKSSGDGGDLCYADTETKSGDILDQEVSQGARVVIRITSQAYTFESEGCGSWTKIG